MVDNNGVRTALVTGGTRGIGRGICELLKEKGYRVIAGYGGNQAAAAEFTEQTGIPAYQWDVADFDACQKAVEKISAEHGIITILVTVVVATAFFCPRCYQELHPRRHSATLNCLQQQFRNGLLCRWRR